MALLRHGHGHSRLRVYFRCFFHSQKNDNFVVAPFHQILCETFRRQNFQNSNLIKFFFKILFIFRFKAEFGQISSFAWEKARNMISLFVIVDQFDGNEKKQNQHSCSHFTFTRINVVF